MEFLLIWKKSMYLYKTPNKHICIYLYLSILLPWRVFWFEQTPPPPPVPMEIHVFVYSIEKIWPYEPPPLPSPLLPPSLSFPPLPSPLLPSPLPPLPFGMFSNSSALPSLLECSVTLPEVGMDIFWDHSLHICILYLCFHVVVVFFFVNRLKAMLASIAVRS